MKKLLWAIGLFMLAGCGRASATRPVDFAVRLHEDGGMTPFSHDVWLTTGEGEDEIFLNGLNLRVQFVPDEAALDTLYETVIANRFARIRTYEEEVYDRGGTSIGVQQDGEMVWVYDNGMSFVREGWQDEYEAIYAAAYQFVTPQPDAAAGSFTLTWDESLNWGGWEIRVVVGTAYRGMTEVTMMTPEVTLYTQNPSGQYPITLSNSNTGKTTTFTLDLTQHQRVVLSQNGGEPVVVGGD